GIRDDLVTGVQTCALPISRLKIPQDQVQFSDDELEHVNLAVEELDEIRLDGVLGPDVHDMDLALLTEAMHPSDPLLDPERIPREVVIDHGPRELQVPTLAARLRAQQHRGPRLALPDGLVLCPGP